MRRRVRPALACGWALVALAACRVGGAPVAELASDRSQVILSYPELADLDVTLTPRAARPAAGELTLFVHLLDQPGSVVRTFDQPLGTQWRPGEPQKLRLRLYQSALADPLAPGDYLLAVGLYAQTGGGSGERYPLSVAGPEIARAEYRLATVRVPPPSSTLPRLRFSDRWLPSEPGTDRQILGRRWLLAGSPGELEIGPLAGPGALWLRLEIPGAAGGDRLEPAKPSQPPGVEVSADCGGFESSATGQGKHDFEIAVPAGSPVTCRVRVEPDYRLVRAAGGESVSAALEILSWSSRGETN